MVLLTLASALAVAFLPLFALFEVNLAFERSFRRSTLAFEMVRVRLRT